MNENSGTDDALTIKEWIKNVLKIIGLMAGIIWKFWIHPHYTTGGFIGVVVLTVIAAGAYLFVRFYTRTSGSFLILFPLGLSVVTTVLYATHL